MKTIIIMNEQHNLLPQQEELINGLNAPVEIIKVPADGWNKRQILDCVDNIKHLATRGERLNIVVLSPIPLLLAALSMLQGYGELDYSAVYVLHNDRREKKELPNGKIISVVAQEGWELIDIEEEI